MKGEEEWRPKGNQTRAIELVGERAACIDDDATALQAAAGRVLYTSEDTTGALLRDLAQGRLDLAIAHLALDASGLGSAVGRCGARGFVAKSELALPRLVELLGPPDDSLPVSWSCASPEG